jgi:serine kinase of HPr protein (carbohydrate metabolism regulator)
MNVKEFAEFSQSEIITCADDAKDNEITGGYCCDLLSYVIGRCKAGNAWITIMTNINVVAVAMLADVSCVIIPENNEIEQETVNKAEAQGIVILRTKMNAFEISCKLGEFLNS